MADLWLIRHGETAWSLSGAHTGRTDIPLTPAGEEQAAGIRTKLGGRNFALVLSSPLERARRTCELAGFAGVMQLEPNLAEWAYGEYEGKTTAQIRVDRPGWAPFKDDFPGGETLEDVAVRAQAVIDRAVAAGGDVALFAHQSAHETQHSVLGEEAAPSDAARQEAAARDADHPLDRCPGHARAQLLRGLLGDQAGDADSRSL